MFPSAVKWFRYRRIWIFGFLIILCSGFSAHAQQWSSGDSVTQQLTSGNGHQEGPIVGNIKCVNGTDDGFGQFVTLVPEGPDFVTVIECVVPYRFYGRFSFLQIAVTLQERCLDDQLATRVQVGSVFAEPDPTGDFFNECTDNEFETHSRHWYTAPTKSIKAGDKILVQAQSNNGTAEVGPSRAILVDVVKDFVKRKRR